jgi:hypothetical protein
MASGAAAKSRSSSDGVGSRDIFSLDLLNATLPVGSCGNESGGWKHGSPITLVNGAGSAFTATGAFDGASVDSARVVGYADFDADGTTDALMSITCFGSLPEQCCAGRSSRATFALPLRLGHDGKLGIIGGPIFGGPDRELTTAWIDRNTIVTVEYDVYPELDPNSPTCRPDELILVRYRLEGGSWHPGPDACSESAIPGS